MLGAVRGCCGAPPLRGQARRSYGSGGAARGAGRRSSQLAQTLPGATLGCPARKCGARRGEGSVHEWGAALISAVAALSVSRGAAGRDVKGGGDGVDAKSNPV